VAAAVLFLKLEEVAVLVEAQHMLVQLVLETLQAPLLHKEIMAAWAETPIVAAAEAEPLQWVRQESTVSVEKLAMGDLEQFHL
jgi:hypothetical protein